jgi:hypothetical protein
MPRNALADMGCESVTVASHVVLDTGQAQSGDTVGKVADVEFDSEDAAFLRGTVRSKAG